MKELRKLFYIIALVTAGFALAATADAAERKGGTPWQIANGDLVFGGATGGISGRFLYFENWDDDSDGNANRDFPIDAVLEHDGELWWAETDPALADEPGVASAWVQLTSQGGSGSGSAITAGTADPTGGSDGDAYFQITASNVVESLWRNDSGTWAEYTLPAGGGVTLSDASPENVAAAGNSGTSADASRADHIHDAFSTATPANLGVTAVAGIGAFASRSDHVHRGLSDTDPADVGTAASGTRPFASRDDHVHGGGGDANYRGNWVSSGVYARGDEVHNSSVYWIRNSTTGGSGGTPGNTNTDWYRIVGVETDQSTITGSGLGGNEIGIPNNGIAHAQMSDDSVGLAEMRDDATELLCPDPSGGTAGQVCARNTAGDAYELIDQSAGGGGTDDQTAGEVTVTVTNFNGNLGAADNDVQAALETLDDIDAADIPLVVTDFDGNLGAADNDVQAAFETLDDLAISTAGTDDQTAAEVSVTATGFSGNLDSTDTDVQAALATIDGLSLGGVAGTSAQRIESVTFGNIANITTTASLLTLSGTTPVTVEYGAGVAEMLSGTNGVTTFTIANAGVYVFEFSAIYPVDGDRTTPLLTIYQDSDDAVIGQSMAAYLRNTGTIDATGTIIVNGIVTVPSDNLVVKATLSNAWNTGSLDANDGKLSLVRIGTGLTGAQGAVGGVGPAGADGAGALSDDAPEDIGIADSAPGTSIAASRGDHLHRLAMMAYDDTIAYRKGDSIINGSGADVIVWTASDDIVAGDGEPSLIFQLNWLQNARVGAWMGDVLTNYPRTLNAGDWYRVGDEVYLVKAYQASAIGTEVTSGSNIINLTAASGGDITAVTTASNSGLAGGANTGAVALVVNLPGLPNSSSIVSTGTLAGATGGGSSVEYSVGAVSAYVQAQAVTDTALNATSALEAQSVAPSRQLVAELRDTLSANQGASLSDDLPVNIGPQGQQGTGDESSRDDHTHYLPHDNTLGFTAGALGVSISDVVEHLSERIQYYTEEADYSTGGSAAGQVYNTSRYPKNLQWVKAHLRVPTGVSDAIYRAGVYIVDETRNITAVLGQSGTSGILTGTVTHRFDFLAEDTSTLGIPLEGGERIEILIRRVGAGDTADTGLIRGAEHQNSPTDSYIDAENDFVLVNHVVIEQENPGVGQGTDFHGEAIRGNLQLGYTITIDHGSLIGDVSNVDPVHINSGTSPRTDALYADGSGVTEFRAAHPRPTGVWYGADQTGKHAAPTAKTFLAGRYYRLTYESNAPDQHYEGGNAMGALVLDAVAATDYDLITRDNAAELRRDKKVIQLTPGRYRFKTKVWSSAIETLEAGLFVYRSVSGDDTLAWVASGGYGEAVNDPLGTGDITNTRVLEFEEVIEHAVTTHYTQILVMEDENGDGIAVEKQWVSFYTEIERL